VIAVAGLTLIVTAGAAGLFGAVVLWKRSRPGLSIAELAVAGAALGGGALMVQGQAGPGDWVIAVGALAVLAPAHCWALFGRPGDLSGAWSGQGLLPMGFWPRTKTGNPRSQMEEPGLATEPTPPPPPAAPATPANEVVTAMSPEIKRSPRRKARQTRVVIRKVGPWSVFKFSLLFYLCVVAVILLALAMLYGILGAVGALEHVTEFARNLFADKSFSIHGGWIFARLTVIGLAMVVIWSLINLFIAFLYNLISDVIGGIDVTLSERH
jgi:hypothetical protein